jgi:hypothetical protein
MAFHSFAPHNQYNRKLYCLCLNYFGSVHFSCHCYHHSSMNHHYLLESVFAMASKQVFLIYFSPSIHSPYITYLPFKSVSQTHQYLLETIKWFPIICRINSRPWIICPCSSGSSLYSSHPFVQTT